MELKPGVSESYRGGKGFDTIAELFTELHAGVKELGVGVGEVLSHDDPQRTPARLGFDLCVENLGIYRYWEFSIELPKLNASRSSLSPRVTESLLTSKGRASLARAFQEGVGPEGLEAWLEALT